MDYSIRPASILDLSPLRALERRCFGSDAWSLLDLLAVLSYPDVIRLKALAEGKMIGFIAGDPRPKEGFSWIATVGVLPEYRRQGVGRALLRACEAKLPTPLARLSVRVSNFGAIHLYETEGYRTIDLWRGYYRDGGDAIVMEKTLRAV